MKVHETQKALAVLVAVAAVYLAACAPRAAAAPPAPSVIPIAADSAWSFSSGDQTPAATGAVNVVPDGPDPDGPAIELSADFTGGGNYAAAGRNFDDTDVGDTSVINVSVASTNVTSFSVRLVDCTGQTHVAHYTITADGSSFPLTIRPASIASGDYWGGADDGKWHPPLRAMYVVVAPKSSADGQPVLSFGGVTLESTPLPLSTILKASVSPAACPQGKPLKITLNWDAKPMSRNCTVFVHILDKDGDMVMQGDHSPVAQTTSWSGSVTDTTMLVVPNDVADGTYTILAGLYYQTKGKEGMENRNAPLLAGEGVSAGDWDQFNVGTLTIDHNAPPPPFDTDEPKTLDLTGYHLTFDEDFTEPTLDVSRQGPGTRWIAHTPYWGDFGDAAFGDPGPDSPFSIKDGVLTIEAKKVNGRWTSGLLSSVDTKGNGFSQCFGYFEMRAKLPKGPGTWPAFWMSDVTNLQRPTPKVTNMEIDILEQYGISDTLMHTTLHWWYPDRPEWAVYRMEYVPDMTDDFHDYGLMWTKEYLIWYFDGKELFRVKTPEELQTHKEYMMVNLALGSGWPIDQTPNPSDMLVKWVRAYQKAD